MKKGSFTRCTVFAPNRRWSYTETSRVWRTPGNSVNAVFSFFFPPIPLFLSLPFNTNRRLPVSPPKEDASLSAVVGARCKGKGGGRAVEGKGRGRSLAMPRPGSSAATAAPPARAGVRPWACEWVQWQWVRVHEAWLPAARTWHTWPNGGNPSSSMDTSSLQVSRVTKKLTEIFTSQPNLCKRRQCVSSEVCTHCIQFVQNVRAQIFLLCNLTWMPRRCELRGKVRAGTVAGQLSGYAIALKSPTTVQSVVRRWRRDPVTGFRPCGPFYVTKDESRPSSRILRRLRLARDVLRPNRCATDWLEPSFWIVARKINLDERRRGVALRVGSCIEITARVRRGEGLFSIVLFRFCALPYNGGGLFTNACRSKKIKGGRLKRRPKNMRGSPAPRSCVVRTLTCCWVVSMATR